MALDIHASAASVDDAPASAASRTRPVWRWLLLVPVYLLCTIALLASVAVVGMRIMGIEPMVVRTSSMEPTIMAGDLILAKGISGPLELGKIYIHQSPETGGDTAHRLLSAGPEVGTWYTKGDNNEVRDEYLLTDADFSREVVGWLPSMGYVNNALAHPLLRTLMFLAPLGLFLPSLIRGARRRSAVEGPDAAADGEADAVSTHAFHLSRTDKAVSALIALGIFGLLAARLVMNVTPVVVASAAADAPLAGGSMALVQPVAVSSLVPGDVVFITMPEQDVPTFRIVTDPDPEAPLAPASPGNEYVFTVDATDSPGATPKAAQLATDESIPGVVTAIPRLGVILPVLATPTGFAGLIAILGLFASLLLIRISLAGTRSSSADATNADARTTA